MKTWKLSTSVRKEKKCVSAKIYSKSRPSTHEIVKKEKETVQNALSLWEGDMNRKSVPIDSNVVN